MSDSIRTPYTDKVGKEFGYTIIPAGSDPCSAPEPSEGSSYGRVDPVKLPFNSLKIGTPDKGNSGPNVDPVKEY